MFYLATIWVISRLMPEMADVHLHQRALLFYSLGGLLLGGQLISIGFLAELITARTARDVDTYSVSEQTGDAPDDRPIHEELADHAPAGHGEDSPSGNA